MPLPQENKEYSTKEYWNSRYSEEDADNSYDWFKSYADLADHIRVLIPDRNARILMLGCGNCQFSEDMWEDGYKNIVNVDYSAIVIEQMRARHALLRPEMEWHEMDVRALSFDDASFDVAIDKGTMDAMMSSSTDVWNPPEETVKDCTAEVSEVLRCRSNLPNIFAYEQSSLPFALPIGSFDHLAPFSMLRSVNLTFAKGFLRARILAELGWK